MPAVPKMPPKGHIFQNQSAPSFIAKRREDLLIYCRQALAMLREGGTGEALLSPALCSFFVVPEHIWKTVQQRYFRRRQSVHSNHSESWRTQRSDTGSPIRHHAASFDGEGSDAVTHITPRRLVLTPPNESRGRLKENGESIKLLASQLTRQAATVSSLNDTEENRILGYVRLLENVGSMSVAAVLTTSSALVVGVALKRIVWSLSTIFLSSGSGGARRGPRHRHLLSPGLIGAGMLTALGWWLKRAAERASVKTNAWKRKASILYGTIVILSGYKFTRWYSKYTTLDARESKLLYSFTHKVMAKYVYRCLATWQGFWVKAGQYMSARADVVPKAYVQELAQLQDGTIPQPFETVRRIVEAALLERHGRSGNAVKLKLEDVFSRFDEAALASASIAQVHRATVRGVDGQPSQDVVVKCQHAGIEELMRLDMIALLKICKFVAWSEPEFNFEPLMTEWTAAAVKELDFVHESANLMAVADGLSDPEGGAPPHLCAMVRVPRVLPRFTTRKVMVLEFSPGISVGSDAVRRSLDLEARSALLQLVTEATAHQIFHIGVFNGDPHPGNILVELPGVLPVESKEGEKEQDEDEARATARPVLLDFGLSKRLAKELRLSFCKMIVSASELDFVGLIESFEDMGWVFEESNDFTETMDLMRFFFRDTAPTVEARKQLLAFDRAMKNKTKARRKMKVRRPVKAFPGDILFFIRALELLRGLCSQLGIRQSPMKIMAASARKAIAAALLDASLASFVESARNPGDNAFSIPLSIPEHYHLPASSSSSNNNKEGPHARLQEKIEHIVERLRADGTLLGCQVAVVVKGKLAVEVCAGPISPYEGDPRMVQGDTLFSSFSCTKAVAATALHMLIAEGKATYTDRVSQHWPAFGCRGKENITIEDVLSHRAGLSTALPPEFSLHMMCDFDRMADYLAGCAPEKGFDDGTARYHYLTFGWLVGKLVQILSGGMPFGEFVRQRISEPLGLGKEMVVGIPEKWLLPCWDTSHTELTRMHANRLAVIDKVFSLGDSDGDGGEDEIEAILERAQGRAEALLNDSDKQHDKKEHTGTDSASGLSQSKSLLKGKAWSLDSRLWNAKRVRAACIPAANGHFSARALALFYSVLMQPIASIDATDRPSDKGGIVILPEYILRQAVHAATTLRDGDGVFGLGYKRHVYQVVDNTTGQRVELFGFGHGGAGGSTGLCVPHADVSFAFTTSRMALTGLPVRKIFSIVCEELGLGECEELTRVVENSNGVSDIA